MYSWRVPLRASGKLLIAASQDIGGLGAKDGPPVEYTWVPGSLLPRAVPWLALFGLLMLKRNRTLSAWWIWVPLACALGLSPALRNLMASLPDQPVDIVLETLKGAAFGTAAVWLIAGYLGWTHRFLSFLAIIGTSAVFGSFTVALSQWEEWNVESSFALVATLLACFIITATVMLAGLGCRRLYGALRFLLGSVAAFLVVSAAISALLLGLIWLLTHGHLVLAPVLAAIFVLSIMSFGALLPFLLLTCANPFYRERIKDLLHLATREAPPVIAPTAGAQPEGSPELQEVGR